MTLELKGRSSRRDFLKKTGVAAATMAAGPFFLSSRSRAASFYEGRTIEILVPFSEGGATDVGARFMAPFLERHIPGNPTVRVRTMPGAASILGANYFEEHTTPDAELVLCTTSSTSFPYLLGQEGVAYDLSTKRVGMTLPFGPVVYTSPATGVEQPADLLNPARPLVYGGIGATASDMPVILAFELLELDFRAVLGFGGRGPIRLAFERGETNLDFQFTPVYLSQVVHLVEEGRAVPLMTGGAVDPNTGAFTRRDAVVSDLPSVYEVYQAMHGEEPSGVPWAAYQAAAVLTFTNGLTWWMHGDTPPEALEAWYAAVDRTLEDPQFHEQGKDVIGGYPIARGDETEDGIQQALHPALAVTDWLKDLMRTKYDVQF